MEVLRGSGVGSGVRTGQLRWMPDALAAPSSAPRVAPVEVELAAVQAAMTAVAEDLRRVGLAAGGEARAIVDAQAMMAADPALLEEVTRRLEDGCSGERAVCDALDEFRAALTAAGGAIAERAADVADLSQRIVARLRGVSVPGVPHSATPFVLIAHDLAPADVASLDPTVVLAVVTCGGGPTSHAAIVARAHGIPAVVAVSGAEGLIEEEWVRVDAGLGTVQRGVSADPVAPEPAATAGAAAQPGPNGAAAQPGPTGTAAPTRSATGQLADGQRVSLLANIGSLAEIAGAVEAGAEGVGLFRTEFLFADARACPTVADQLSAYSAVCAAFPGAPVVVRCFDPGGDKPLAFVRGGEGANPALGVRGIRALRANPSLLSDQLAALRLAQDASGAELSVMAPMIADASEAEFFAHAARAAGLRSAGVMAEVPAVAVLADQVVAVTDFVSIGTNDLSQFALAADRMLGELATYQDPWHPAVLRLVRMVGAAGVRAGVPVGVCGEAAADPLLAVVLVGLGASSLSMAPPALAAVRAELARWSWADAERAAFAACDAVSASDARTRALALRPA